ncbi:uncharacterized protein [Arachis hypogaea]|uniref:uncharacterized protein n=1 Tax=Arachis hypogaea TaxID=3818 RepID=UPI003B217311
MVMGMNSFKVPSADDIALFDTLVVLIPKVDNPSRMKEFRPISLYNVIYKIITKVVVERLRPFLQDIIGPLQGGFIPGRGAPNNIILKRDLRQGDPMSPYLFVICMEMLSCLIARQMEVGRWKPVTVSRGGPTTQDLFTGISSTRFANSLGKYLGVPLKHGIVTKADFNDVVDKLTNRLASWKCRFLNKADQICLAKSVLSSIPIYRMQVSLFPTGVLSNIDKFTRSFIWCGSHNHRGLHLAYWRVLMTPKKFGGLALRESRLVKFSLLEKLVWQILMNQEKLWVKIML